MNIKKEILTNDNIVFDIKHSLKKPAKMSGGTYKILSTISAIIVVIFCVAELYLLNTQSIDPKIAGLVFLPACILFISLGILEYLILVIKRINVRLENYEVVSEVLSHKTEDKHREWVNKHCKKDVSVFTLYFENKKSIRIPEMNYTWSPIRQMSDFSLFNISHRGDEFIIVLNKKTGKIVMAYPAKYFEYKN